METEYTLNQKIFAMRRKIQEEYPELQKYLHEVPNQFTDNPDKKVSLKELEDYLESLKAIVKKYDNEQKAN